jgi:hypothetical protein
MISDGAGHYALDDWTPTNFVILFPLYHPPTVYPLTVYPLSVYPLSVLSFKMYVRFPKAPSSPGIFPSTRPSPCYLPILRLDCRRVASLFSCIVAQSSRYFFVSSHLMYYYRTDDLGTDPGSNVLANVYGDEGQSRGCLLQEAFYRVQTQPQRRIQKMHSAKAS